jgi:arsenite methyltransferase
VGCIAGALSDLEYVAKLAKAGIDKIEIEPTRVYNIEDARSSLSARGLDVDALLTEVEDKFISAFIRADKPAFSDGSIAALQDLLQIVFDWSDFHLHRFVRPGA